MMGRISIVMGLLCSVALAQTAQPTTSLASNAGPTTDPSLVMDLRLRQPHAAPKPGQVLEMQIEQLGNFTYDFFRGGGIPADVLALDGCTIRIFGHMMPLVKAENITDFAMVQRNIEEYNPLGDFDFVRWPPAQQIVIVHMAQGKSMAKFTEQELVVEGKLKIAETKDDDFVISVFEIAATSVRSVPMP